MTGTQMDAIAQIYKICMEIKMEIASDHICKAVLNHAERIEKESTIKFQLGGKEWGF